MTSTFVSDPFDKFIVTFGEFVPQITDVLTACTYVVVSILNTVILMTIVRIIIFVKENRSKVELFEESEDETTISDASSGVSSGDCYISSSSSDEDVNDEELSYVPSEIDSDSESISEPSLD